MYLVCSGWVVNHDGKLKQETKIELFFHDGDIDFAKEFARKLKEREPHKTVFVTEVIEELAF